MAANRYRLRSLASQGSRGATLALDLLARTGPPAQRDPAVQQPGEYRRRDPGQRDHPRALRQRGWASAWRPCSSPSRSWCSPRSRPRSIGANHADRLAPIVAYPLTGLLRASYFAVWFINLFSRGLLNLMRLQPEGGDELGAVRRGTARDGDRLGPVHPAQAPQHAAQPLRPREHHGRGRDDAARRDRKHRSLRPGRRRPPPDRHQLPHPAGGPTTATAST